MWRGDKLFSPRRTQTACQAVLLFEATKFEGGSLCNEQYKISIQKWVVPKRKPKTCGIGFRSGHCRLASSKLLIGARRTVRKLPLKSGEKRTRVGYRQNGWNVFVVMCTEERVPDEPVVHQVRLKRCQEES